MARRALPFVPVPGLHRRAISWLCQCRTFVVQTLRLDSIFVFSFDPSTPDPTSGYPLSAEPPPLPSPVIEHHSATPLIFSICGLVFI